MWTWINCYLSGRHDYGVTCSSGAMYLRCIHCSKRSEGWTVHGQPQQHAAVRLMPAKAGLMRALPFTRRNTVDAVNQQRSA